MVVPRLGRPPAASGSQAGDDVLEKTVEVYHTVGLRGVAEDHQDEVFRRYHENHLAVVVLAHRKVVAFPDVDGYQEWTEKLAKYPELDITVSPLLQQNATPEDMEAHIDIADWLIRTRVPMFNPGLSRHSEAFLKVAQFVDPKYHAELEGLIDDFELEFVGFEPKPSLPSEDFS